jgi:acyl-CoA reductase-like NAD-dependent aldehyde dehydrogenase
VGDPRAAVTDVGPLLSPERVAAVESVLHEAVADGARLLAGGTRPPGLEEGCWLAPAVLGDVRADAAVAQEETFGPVAVVLAANDLGEAIALANGVPHGLVAGLVTRDRGAQARFEGLAEAGILKLGAGPLAVHPDAPFGGWKASGIGPPEHGRWDAEIYSRVQAIYGEVESHEPS